MKKLLEFEKKYHTRINIIFLLIDVAFFIGSFIHKDIIFAIWFAFLSGTALVLCFADPLIEAQNNLIEAQQVFIDHIIGITKEEIKHHGHKN